MTLSTFVIDDEFHAIAVLEAYIHQTPGLIWTGHSTEPVKALEVLALAPPAVLFLDVRMPQLSGIELAGLIDGRQTRIVFTTSYREFGPEAFEQAAADYLLKPISYDRFLKCIQKIKNEPTGHGAILKEPPFFYVKGNVKGNYIKIVTAEIVFIESNGNYVNIHLLKEKVIAYLTLSEILEKLPAETFCRVHRLYIINTTRISRIASGQIHLTGQAVVALGKSFRDAFFDRIHPSLLISYRDRED